MSSTQIITSAQSSTYVSSVKSATNAYKQQAMENVSNNSVATESTKVSISQKAQSIASTAPSGESSRGSYDFTNMTPNQMGQLASDGKITGGHFMLTEAQFQAGMQANLKGLTGTDLQDAVNAANNTPTNYIQLYTKSIKDSKAAGIDTTGLENVLRQMMDLQGSPIESAQSTENTQHSAEA